MSTQGFESRIHAVSTWAVERMCVEPSITAALDAVDLAVDDALGEDRQAALLEAVRRYEEAQAVDIDPDIL